MKKFYSVLWTVLALLCFGQELSFAQCDGRRPDIYDFSPADRLVLREAMMDYLKDDIDVAGSFGISQLEYVNVAIHSGWNGNTQNANLWHNGQEVGFLTWHRQYIQGMEDYLIANGHSRFVPLPAWDNSTRIPNEFFNNTVSPGSAVLPASDGFPPLVNQGPFGFGSTSFDPYVPMDCSDWFNINVMANNLESSPHNNTHVSIGGSMQSVLNASGAAIFWLFHAYIDEVYYCYQEECQGLGHDIYVREDEEDFGQEPNDDSERVWVSPDIWVRNDNDGFKTDNRISETLCHKDGAVQGEKPVYVYVRVWNAGDLPNPDREGSITAYWSHPDAGLIYPESFDDIPSSICDLPTGGMIGTQALRSVDETIIDQFDVNNNGDFTDEIRDYTIYEFEWTPPNPDDYEDCMGDQHKHFCILARVDDGIPLVIESNAGKDLRRNNNLALKNITILGSDDEDHDDFADCEDIIWNIDGDPDPEVDCIFFGNHTEKLMKNVMINLGFVTQVDAMMLQTSNMYIHMEGELADMWQSGQITSQGLAFNCATNTAMVTSPNARFRIAQVQARQVFRFCVAVDGDPAAALPQNMIGVKKSFDWDFVQTNNGELHGGERFTLGVNTFTPTNGTNGQIGTVNAQQAGPFVCDVQIEQLTPCDFTYTSAGCAGPAIALWVDADGNQFAGDTLNNVAVDGKLTLYLTNAYGCQLGTATINAAGCEIPLGDLICSNINSSSSGNGDWSDSFVSNGNGSIILEFYTASVPDRLEVSVNGVQVVNSGEYSTFLCTNSYANCQGNVVPGCGTNYIVEIPVSYMDQVDMSVYGNTCQAGGTYWSLDAACSDNFVGTAVASRSTLFGEDDAHFGEALVNVFPNPATSLLNIEKKDFNPYGVVITNALGATMCNFTNKTGTLKLDVSKYPAGIYLVKVVDEIKKVQTVSKIVIQ